MVIYESAERYIESGTNICDKIVKIDTIISALMLTAVKAATNDHITEYGLDDGQTKIKTIYRGADAVLKSIEMFEKLRRMYITQHERRYNGSVIRLVDSKNFQR